MHRSAKEGLSVLVVDDSVIYRKILSQVVEVIPGLTLFATSSNGQLALKRLATGPCDLVLLDVEMPEMDGIETLRRIRRLYPEVGVIMVSGLNRDAADKTMEALELGAIEFVAKPHTKDPGTSREQLVGTIKPVIRMVQARRGVVIKPKGPPARAESLPAVKGKPVRAAARRSSCIPGSFDLVAIGVSTGGPKALANLLPELPGNFPIPIAIVQHMPANFTESLAKRLDTKSALCVKEAEGNDILSPGRVLLAPGGRHMKVHARNGDLVVELNDGPPVRNCRPSVDVLFHSLADSVKGKTLTVMLTGMGDDGVDGVRDLSRKGSYNLIQNEESSVVFGMPQAVAQAGLADEVLSLDRLAVRIDELVKRRFGK